MIELRVETTSYDRADDGWYLLRKLALLRHQSVRTVYEVRIVK